MYYKVEFEIAVTFHSATMEFALVYKGKKYDGVATDYV